MADEERKVAENADAEKKKVKRFAYQDVEVSVSKMMTPSVKKLLEEDYKIDMATVLPVIHQSSPALDENETIEQYSRRCIESALAMQVQKNDVNYIESKRGEKDAVVVDVEDAAKKQQEEPEMGDNEGADIYAQANAAQTRIVLMMLGMPFKVLAALVEEEKIAAKFNGKKAEVVELRPDEAAHIKAKLERVEKQLAEAYAKDGVVLEAEEEKKEEPKTEAPKKPEPIVKKQEELSEEALQVPGDNDTVKLKNGKDLTFADYKAALKQLAENPEIKKMVDELGINIDDVANEMFNKIEASAYEDVLGVAEASMQYVIGRKVALDAYTKKTPGFQKLNNEDEKKGIQENKDGDPRNALFDNMKDILKFPFQAFKIILSGKTDEELKAEADRLNLKDVHLELTTLSREALTKKLEQYESTLAAEVKRLRGVKETEIEDPNGPVRLKKEPKTTNRVRRSVVDIKVVKPEEASGRTDGTEPKSGPTPAPEETTPAPEQEPIDADKALEEADRALNGETYKEPQGRRKITPSHVTGSVDENKKILAELAAEVDKLDFDDPVSTMIWASDLARAAAGSNGPVMSEEDRKKVVAALEAKNFYSKGDVQLPSFQNLTQKGRQVFILTSVSRMLGSDGSGKVSMDVAKMAESIIAKEAPEQAHEGLVVGKEAYDRNEPKVDKTKMSQADAAYQQKIDKLMKDFDALDFSDRTAVISWMQEYGKTAAAMESVPAIDKAAIEKKFKENGIDTREGATNKFSPNEKDKNNATEWCITAGALAILSTGRIDDKVTERMSRVTAPVVQEQTPEQTQEEELLPLTEIGTNATKKVVQDALDVSKGDIEGKILVDAMNRDMHPELYVALEEEEKRKQQQQNELDDDSHYPSYPGERR